MHGHTINNIDNALKDLNINLIKTDVGDKNVYQALKKNNLSLGGEQSGHIIFLDDATTGDGILTSIKILNISSLIFAGT